MSQNIGCMKVGDGCKHRIVELTRRNIVDDVDAIVAYTATSDISTEGVDADEEGGMTVAKRNEGLEGGIKAP